MKKSIFTIILLSSLSLDAAAQSKSFALLKEKFRHQENVFSFSTSGFLTRTLLSMAGEHEFNEAIREVRQIAVTIIPARAFADERVTVKGFLKLAKSDNFQELLSVRDGGDNVTLLLQANDKNKDNRYLLIVENGDEIVAMEIRGYIDTDMMRKSFKKNQNHYQQEI